MENNSIEKMRNEELFILVLIDRVLNKGASISLQTFKDGSMYINCIPKEKESDE